MIREEEKYWKIRVNGSGTKEEILSSLKELIKALREESLDGWENYPDIYEDPILVCEVDSIN